jgi:hypothetical protein
MQHPNPEKHVCSVIAASNPTTDRYDEAIKLIVEDDLRQDPGDIMRSPTLLGPNDNVIHIIHANEVISEVTSYNENSIAMSHQMTPERTCGSPHDMKLASLAPPSSIQGRRNSHVINVQMQRVRKMKTNELSAGSDDTAG